MLFKNPVPTSKKPLQLNITKNNWLTLLKFNPLNNARLNGI